MYEEIICITWNSSNEVLLIRQQIGKKKKKPKSDDKRMSQKVMQHPCNKKEYSH